MVERVNFPQTKTAKLSNGLKLISMRAGTQEVLRLSLVFHAGLRYQHRPYAASTALNILSEGSEKYSSAQISTIMDSFGIYYDTNIDRDYSMITISCLNKFLPQSLELLEQILLHPTFDPQELSKYISKRKQSIRIEREKPSYIAREEFSKALFGKDHPYGTASDIKDYDSLTVSDLKQHYQKHYTAQNCFAVTSGMVNQAELEQIIRILEKIPQGEIPESKPIPEIRSILKNHIKRDGALQSCIRIGKVTFSRHHPDYNNMQIIAMILGGYFGSRLVKNLREDKGYTYGAYSAMVTLEHSGYFAIATDVRIEYRDEAIKQILLEIEILRTELISEEELEMVRNTISGELMRLVDGPFGIADIAIETEQCGTTNDLINEFLADVKNITPQKLLEVAIKYLDPKTLTTVTVG